MAGGRSELRETRADILSLPGLILVVLIAVVVRQFFGQPPSATVLVVCGVIAVLDLFLARYLLHTGSASFVATPEDITFTPRRSSSKIDPRPQVIRRVPTSALEFHLQSNGFIGDQPVYRLLLRDIATGDEVAATSFGRAKVRKACESQGWTFC